MSAAAIAGMRASDILSEIGVSPGEIARLAADRAIALPAASGIRR